MEPKESKPKTKWWTADAVYKPERDNARAVTKWLNELGRTSELMDQGLKFEEVCTIGLALEAYEKDMQKKYEEEGDTE